MKTRLLCKRMLALVMMAVVQSAASEGSVEDGFVDISPKSFHRDVTGDVVTLSNPVDSSGLDSSSVKLKESTLASVKSGGTLPKASPATYDRRDEHHPAGTRSASKGPATQDSAIGVDTGFEDRKDDLKVLSPALGEGRRGRRAQKAGRRHASRLATHGSFAMNRRADGNNEEDVEEHMAASETVGPNSLSLSLSLALSLSLSCHFLNFWSTGYAAR